MLEPEAKISSSRSGGGRPVVIIVPGSFCGWCPRHFSQWCLRVDLLSIVTTLPLVGVMWRVYIALCTELQIVAATRGYRAFR
jgi:hypothetical protein